MNSEPSPAASSQAPTEAAAGTGIAATAERDDTTVGAHVTVSASLAEVLPAEDPLNAPGLSPAAELANAPGLSPAACGVRLAELFPALFSAPGAPGPAKPIKLRIHADIQMRAPGVFSKRVLGIFFSRYTTTNAYLKALTLAPHRFDLDGQAAGEISEEHRQLAAEELARRHALAAERRAAQRPPPRRAAPAREDGAAPGAQWEAPPARRPDMREGARPGPRLDSRHAAPPPRSRDVVRRTDGRNDAMPVSRPQRSASLLPTPQAQAPAALPADPAQRERALLKRSFESSPLNKANFCALKGISEATLDAALAQADNEGPLKAARKQSGSGQ